MEAKDTVMSSKELSKITYRDVGMGFGKQKIGNCCQEAIKAQAEISFKAGKDSRKDEIEGLMSIAFKDGEGIGSKAGMKEVVEFVKEHGHPSRDTWHWEIDRDDWQAFLKSKGIK